jgi:hypothetical protein
MSRSRPQNGRIALSFEASPGLIGYLLWVGASWFICSLRLRRVMLRLTPLVTASAVVLLVLNLVTGFACDIQTEAAMT